LATAAASIALPAAAVSACRSADALIAPAPAAAPDHFETGVNLYQQGRYAEAEAELRAASGAEAKAYLAASLAKQKKYAEAEKPAKEAVEANPTHEVAVAALGESLVGQKKYDEAVEKMSAAIKVKAEQPYAYFWRGQAENGRKHTDKMIADFETFLRLAPKAPEAPTVRQLLSSLH
jgi:tetratricopeptide (TPR) repeat protein